MLRDYQQKALDQIKAEFLKGNKRVLLWAATGAGKTVIFCHMVKNAIERGKKPVIVVRGRKLVDQASVKLTREGVDHGVLMANHWNYRPHLPVQVCSIDTVISRKHFPRSDLIIVDEAHMASSAGYKEFLSHYPGAFIVACTATPYVDKGLRHVANSIVHPITMQELIDQGHLVPFRFFAPTVPDLKGVKIVNKEYKNDELEERMLEGDLCGRIVTHWKEIASDRKTLLFAVNIHHSKVLRDTFLSAGIPAEHCDSDTSDEDREKIIGRLERGETKVVCNVGIFCTGVDIPSLGAIIMARPIKSSYNLFIQQAGRGTRTFHDKSDCILLDHADNIAQHGFPTLEPDVDLDGKIASERGKINVKNCKKCFAIYRGKVCPECGTEPETMPAVELVESDEKLKEFIVEKTPIEQWFQFLSIKQKREGKKKAWIYYRLVEKFGEGPCKLSGIIPDWFWERNSYNDPFSRSPFSGLYRE